VTNSLFDRAKTKGGYCIFDIETTGLSPYNDDIIEVCVLQTNASEVVDEFHSFVSTQKRISAEVSCINGIKNKDLFGAPSCSDVLNQIYMKYGSLTFVGHNCLNFDAKFFISKKPLLFSNINYIDTRTIARDILPGLKAIKDYSQGTLCSLFGIKNDREHSAKGDTKALKELFDIFLRILDYDVSRYIINGSRVKLKKEESNA